MLMIKTCPQCGQPVPEHRLGVRLTPYKARIFDAVVRAGDDGILGEDLYDLVCREGQSQRTLKVHIWQINDLLSEEGYRIQGGRLGYRLRKIEP